MNAQLQPHRSAASDSISRSSAQAPSAAQANAETSPTFAEDRSTSTGRERRVDPLWMITGAAALLFVFLAAIVAFD